MSLAVLQTTESHWTMEQKEMDSSESETSEQSENEIVELEQQHESIESENIAFLSAQSTLLSRCQCSLLFK